MGGGADGTKLVSPTRNSRVDRKGTLAPNELAAIREAMAKKNATREKKKKDEDESMKQRRASEIEGFDDIEPETINGAGTRWQNARMKLAQAAQEGTVAKKTGPATIAQKGAARGAAAAAGGVFYTENENREMLKKLTSLHDLMCSLEDRNRTLEKRLQELASAKSSPQQAKKQESKPNAIRRIARRMSNTKANGPAPPARTLTASSSATDKPKRRLSVGQRITTAAVSWLGKAADSTDEGNTSDVSKDLSDNASTVRDSDSFDSLSASFKGSLAEISHHAKPAEDEAMIKQALRATRSFQAFPDELIDIAVGAFQLSRRFTHGQAVAVQGTASTYFFIVLKGAFRCESELIGAGLLLDEWKHGSAFNEAVLYTKEGQAVRPSQFSCSCSSPEGVLYALPFEAFQRLERMKVSFYKQSSVLELLVDEPLTHTGKESAQPIVKLLSSCTEAVYRSADELLGASTEPSTRGPAYVIKSGDLVMELGRSDGNNDDQRQREIRYTRGDVLSRDFILAAHAARQRVSCVIESVYLSVLRIPPELIEKRELLPETMQKQVETLYLRKVLSSIEAFSSFSPDELDTLIGGGQRVEFAPQTMIYEEGSAEGSVALQVVYHGIARASKGEQTLGEFGIGDHFGGSSILQALQSPGTPIKPRQVTVVATEPLKCLVLTSESFGPLVHKVVQCLSRELANRQWIIQYRNRIRMAELDPGPVLGVGAYGRVRIATHKPNGNTYAVKMISKSSLLSENMVQQVANERSLLASCNHPFILKLVASYQCSMNLYFVLEVVLGGELFALLEQREKFDVQTARFYAANVCSACVYFHNINLVFRDLKPENLLIADDGYLKVIDFGFAKTMDGQLFTLCGTSEYMSPEIVCCKPQGTPVDAWALGVLVYEMCMGGTPFCSTVADLATNDYTTYKNILSYARGNRELAFPWLFDSDCSNFILSLLNPDPAQRLRAPASFDHPFLKSIDMLQLEAKALAPPFIPAIANQSDVSNFEQYDSKFDSPPTARTADAWASGGQQDVAAGSLRGFSATSDPWATFDA